jgi:peptidoglycan/xylan/chitin deacetylase (PgdA/CDA1 family)
MSSKEIKGDCKKRPLLVDAWRLATTPWRQWCMRTSRRQGTVPVAVLFYHRVADGEMSPWTISPKGFTNHLNWLCNHFDIVSLPEAQRRIRSGNNSIPTVSITFDDGYADNSSSVVPLLIGRRIPFTYFVTTENVLTGTPFAHDLALGKSHLPNSTEAIRAMADAGVEIGSHTRTHIDLGKVTDQARLYDEVIASTVQLGELIGRRIRYFAFPFGQPANLNGAVFAMARNLGLDGVCSAYGGWNEIGTEGFHLKRFHGDPDLAYIRNWLTFDPRTRYKWSLPEVERMVDESRNAPSCRPNKESAPPIGAVCDLPCMPGADQVPSP